MRKKHQPGCPCCDTGPCAYFDQYRDLEFQVTLAGFVNINCDCEAFLNGRAFLMQYAEPVASAQSCVQGCVWRCPFTSGENCSIRRLCYVQLGFVHVGGDDYKLSIDVLDDGALGNCRAPLRIFGLGPASYTGDLRALDIRIDQPSADSCAVGGNACDETNAFAFVTALAA